MPCDQIRLCQVEFQCARSDLLAAALRGLGWMVHSVNAQSLSATTKSGQRFSIDFKSGRATAPTGAEKIVDEAKRAYTFKLLEASGKRFNWNVKKTGANSVVISRRY